MKVFSVYDSKAAAYLNPFTMRTTAEAIRGFESAVKDPQSQFSKFPSDFSLVQIGEFDELRGEITPSSITILSNASDFVH